MTLSFLLFDGHGRPVPWAIEAQAPSLDLPMIIADLNHDGRAEVVVADCVYRGPPSLGTDLRLTGIYEAKDASWSIARPARLSEYIALVRRRYRSKDVVMVEWPDLSNRPTEQALPVQVTALMKASEDCRGIRFPPIVNGRIIDRSQWKDPCDELVKNRIELSDGTICYAWPTVIVDSAGGREIVAESDHPELLLQKVIEQRRKVILVGQRDPKRCSPVLLWALTE